MRPALLVAAVLAVAAGLVSVLLVAVWLVTLFRRCPAEVPDVCR